ncbi:MAG: preprotein translocase subunit YajC [Acidimicrobiia bacterium]|nr:preprotein translocase subunit YajC [Acidimicrobiia bacterium]
MLILLPLFAVLIYLLFIRPQQRQMRQHKELIESLQVGDEILTSSGIYGTVTDIDGDDMRVEIADGIDISMVRRAVAEVAVDENEAADGADLDDEPAGDADLDG